jgi:hypothetical protein
MKKQEFWVERPGGRSIVRVLAATPDAAKRIVIRGDGLKTAKPGGLIFEAYRIAATYPYPA